MPRTFTPKVLSCFLSSLPMLRRLKVFYMYLHAGAFKPTQDLLHALHSWSSPHGGFINLLIKFLEIVWITAQKPQPELSEFQAVLCGNCQGQSSFPENEQVAKRCNTVISWTQSSDLLWKCNTMEPGNVIQLIHRPQLQRPSRNEEGDPWALVGVSVKTRISFLWECSWIRQRVWGLFW